MSFTPEYPGIGPSGGTKQITVTSTSSALPWTATGQSNIVPGIATGTTLTTFSAAAVPAGAYYVRVRTTDGTQRSPASNALLVLVP